MSEWKPWMQREKERQEEEEREREREREKEAEKERKIQKRLEDQKISDAKHEEYIRYWAEQNKKK